MATAERVIGPGSAKAFGALMLIVVLASIVLLSASALSVRVEYDEAYNLQIVESLRKGDGYSTFGALRWGEPWKFDPHITTGPVVLLPAGAAWSLSDGSVAAVRGLLLFFLAAYVIGWWLLLRQARAGWIVTGLALAPALAVAAPAAGRVLGELPGAALLVWAAFALGKRRPALAALAIGLAIQAKVVYGLAGVVMLAVWLFAAIASDERPRLRDVVLVALLAAAPSLLFELYRFASFGSLEAYRLSIAEFRAFLAEQSVNRLSFSWLDAGILGAKMSGLLGSYPAHAWAALSAGAAALICRNVFKVAEGSSAEAGSEPCVPRETAAALAALFVAGIAMAAGWITQSLQTGARQALPLLLLSVPALVALCLLLSIDFLRRSSAAGRKLLVPRVAVASGAILLSLSMIASLGHSLTQLLRDDIARASALEQREAAAAIRSVKPASIYADGWWQNPEYQLLSGVPGVPWRTGNRQLLVVQDYQLGLTNSTWTQHVGKCAEVVRRTNFTLLCWLPDTPPTEVAFNVLDWGPRSSPLGTVPNTQPGGGGALWIKVENVRAEDVGPVRIHFGPYSSLATLVPDGGTLSAVAPAALFKRAGEHEVVLEQLSTRRRTRVGSFRVE